jgi:flavin reductase (DIM6/NTAB) family NADH-FMN oxidoreductase RutF
MFSINKSRFTASLLAPIIDTKSKQNHCQVNNSREIGVEFVLSVPVRGMEKLVLDVGSVSGRFGSKFPSTNSQEREGEKEDNKHESTLSQLSNRQRKKMKKQQLSQHGIQGLVQVPLGCSYSFTSINPSTQQSSGLFAIQGTVAHLHCRTYAVIGTDSSSDAELNENDNSENKSTLSFTIDDDHLLIMAEVIDAYVHSSYWDEKKLLFCPRVKVGSDNKEDGVPPYLTFYGSQMFGYVTSSNAV